MTTTLKLKKGDTVQMLSGKDRGKQGRIVEARPRDGKVVVENLNILKKHQKPRPRDHLGPRSGLVVERDARLPDLQAADPRRLPLQGHQGRRPRQGARLQARRLRPGDRPVTATVQETYTPRLKQRYNDELRPQLQEQLGQSSIMQAPTIAKITLNMGVGEGKTDAKQIDAALEELTIIAGQRAQVRRARKSIAQFKIRDGMPIGVKVTLRGDRMWEFLDRLVSIALPRIRDFRGLSPDSFDGRGNYSLGIREQIIFPEIDYDSINQVRGLDVAITTTAADDEQARALLTGLGLPFAAAGSER
jgi:large subunit ribosomal protein L5